MLYYLLIIVVATLGTYFLCFPVQKIARLTARNELRSRDIHTEPTPRLGGIAMLMGFVVALLVAGFIPYFSQTYSDGFQLYSIIIASILISVVGIIDDIFNIDWMIKLAGQIVAASIVTVNGVQIMSLPIGGLTIGSNRISMVLTVVIIVAVINAINFIDGLDGLAAGVVGIGAISFFYYAFSLSGTHYNYASLACLITATMIGICIGFLPHNFHPAKIFMGDTGSQLLGLLMASSSLLITGKIDTADANIHSIPAFMPILLPFLVCLLPIFDMLLAIIRRLLKGKSPTSPDQGHLHHKMLELGHSHQVAVLILYIWAVLFAFGGFLFIYLRGRIAFIILLLASIAIVILTASPKLFIKPIFEQDDDTKK
ncbi:MAG: undecaprenyl/decaprenyl-phosphate alpha-N-acetylglucosaminyl 1-phosphate transferase [Candidatus Ancillula sp.]|jgi:UDP-GlcNAc:undecaprenyl-phosphate GlcNAc-1-phosphate transferase|nr:undecaprenyl/decaprenyl-phosphate alpha-N-acetylglucosaminyl 1-phosphate transferase [Candidatus Ancillula sp.]